jgi:RNA polymerase sigma factor (sigma-70 family)
MELSDEALVLACRRGDALAWEALIQRYQRLIYAIPRRSGLNDDQVADVFQHVFATLIENLDSIQQPARVGAWLATTARRESWRLGRHESGATRSVDDDQDDRVAGALPDTTLLPDELMLRLEMQHQMRVAVAALDERCRRLLTLLFYRSDPPAYAEIATALSLPEGSIGPTRARCLKKLRRLLGDIEG